MTIASIYNHPFDFTVTNLIPGMIAIVLLGKIHVITHLMWVFYATIFADFTHCGYDLPWYPWSVFPFGAPIIFHDYHHSSNIGNYGVISTFWDAVCGTNKHFLKYIEEKAKKYS